MYQWFVFDDWEKNKLQETGFSYEIKVQKYWLNTWDNAFYSYILLINKREIVFVLNTFIIIVVDLILKLLLN